MLVRMNTIIITHITLHSFESWLFIHVCAARMCVRAVRSFSFFLYAARHGNRPTERNMFVWWAFQRPLRRMKHTGSQRFFSHAICITMWCTETGQRKQAARTCVKYLNAACARDRIEWMRRWAFVGGKLARIPDFQPWQASFECKTKCVWCCGRGIIIIRFGYHFVHAELRRARFNLKSNLTQNGSIHVKWKET